MVFYYFGVFQNLDELNIVHKHNFVCDADHMFYIFNVLIHALMSSCSIKQDIKHKREHKNKLHLQGW